MPPDTYVTSSQQREPDDDAITHGRFAPLSHDHGGVGPTKVLGSITHGRVAPFSPSPSPSPRGVSGVAHLYGDQLGDEHGEHVLAEVLEERHRRHQRLRQKQRQLLSTTKQHKDGGVRTACYTCHLSTCQPGRRDR
jgi:hypothetical protein